jgi:hypothetical protein
MHSDVGDILRGGGGGSQVRRETRYYKYFLLLKCILFSDSISSRGREKFVMSSFVIFSFHQIVVCLLNLGGLNAQHEIRAGNLKKKIIQNFNR